MNYEKIYQSLIKRAQGRTLAEYSEKHHIIPRCMDGSDHLDNIVKLTPEEHFVAHQLLVKIYPTVDKLIFALAIMSGKKNNNKMFGWHRRKLADAQRKAKLGKKRGPMTDEHKAAIGTANSGENNGMFGKTITEETRNKLKGRIPWNKGTSGIMEAWNKGIKSGKRTSGCFTKGNVPWNKGISKKNIQKDIDIIDIPL